MFSYFLEEEKKAKSYDAKHAVEMIFTNQEPYDIFGEALKEVLEHKNLRGLFNGTNVHPDLKKLVVTEILLKDNGADFRGILCSFFTS